MQNPDLEKVISINPDTREVTVPLQLQNIAVVGDHKAETVYIVIPRKFDGIDLCNPEHLTEDTDHKPYIRYMNANQQFGYSMPVSVESFIGDDDVEYLKLGWLIQRPLTDYAGEIQFSVIFEASTVNQSLLQTTNLYYQWQSLVGKMNILSSLPTEEKQAVMANAQDQFYLEVFRCLAKLEQKLGGGGASSEKVNALQSQLEELNAELDSAAWLGDSSNS